MWVIMFGSNEKGREAEAADHQVLADYHLPLDSLRDPLYRDAEPVYMLGAARERIMLGCLGFVWGNGGHLFIFLARLRGRLRLYQTQAVHSQRQTVCQRLHALPPSSTRNLSGRRARPHLDDSLLASRHSRPHELPALIPALPDWCKQIAPRKLAPAYRCRGKLLQACDHARGEAMTSNCLGLRR